MDKVRASTSVLASAFQGMGGTVGAVGNVMQGFAAGNVAGAVTAAIGEAAKALKWCIGEATSSEQAWKNLSIAVEKSGAIWKDVEAKTRDYTAQLQKTTVYSDEALAGMIERLLTFGMTYDEAMQAAGTALDLAAAKHMDLQSASDLLGKAFMGNTAILQRYGIDVTTSKEATAALKEAVDNVAGALKSAGTDALKPFADILGEAAVSLTDSEGKMRSAKDVAQDLIGAFQSGAIDGEKFSQIMDALGVSIDASKLKTANFPAIMAQLNEQFGGTAQEQAKTYAGIQERLKNATSELGEKIGDMVLPALASLTEGMIPVVDSLGRGVDNFQAFYTELLKAPELKGVIDGLGQAFAGVLPYLEGLQKYLFQALSPALKELMSALKELWDALAPIGEAFGELFAAMSGGEGDFDLLKTLIQGIILEIRGIAEIIKAVAPYIRMFADAFKAAADFIAPILTQMTSAIRGFLDGLKTTFQGFYTWLVGGSLWNDLWKKVADVTRNAGTLLDSIVSGIFDILSGLFKGGMDLIGTIMTTGFSLTFATVKTIVAAAVDVLKHLIGMFQETIHGAMRDWNDLVSVISTTIEPLKTKISDFWTWAKDYWRAAINEIVLATQTAGGQIVATMTGIMGQLQGIVSSGVNAMIGMFNNLVSTAQSAVATAQSLFAQAQQTTNAAQQAISNASTQMASTTQSATQQVTNAFDAAYNTVANGAQWLWNTLTGHSIWTDMLADMQSQTEASLGEIRSSFQGAFENVALSVPAAPGGSRAGLAEPVSVSLGSQSITIPITVTLDGQVISRQVEQRIVERVNLRGKKVA